MIVRKLLIAWCLLLIQACVNQSDRFDSTIADLQHKPIDIDPLVSFDISSRQVIDSYRDLVQITPDGDDYGKEVQRLADLELESSMDNKLSEYPESISVGKQQSELAISRYEQYLKTYPDRPDNDLILYQLSRAYAAESQPDKAMEKMDQLVSDFPDSRYIDETQFRRGESFFVAGQYARAEQAYGVVVKSHHDSLFYEKSLYKYGWCQFKQNRNYIAIESYVQLFDEKQKQHKLDEITLSGNLSRAEKELLSDALRVISLSFSYLPERKPVSHFFNRAGQRAYEPLLYRELGELYLSKERTIDATDIYLSYVKNYPFSKYTPVFHGLAIDAYKKAGFTSLLLPEKERFVKNYNFGTPFWKQQTSETRSILQPILTAHISDLATHYHATARATKKITDYKTAASWYQLYLDSFPNDKKASEINFLLAESRYDAGQYAQAVIEYEKTSYLYPTHKNSAESGYAALIAYNAQVKNSNKKQKPGIINRLIQSSLRFSDKYSDDRRMPNVLLKTAEHFFELNKFPQTIEAATRLVNNPEVEKKVIHSSWVLIAHSEFELANYAQAEIAYLQVIKSLPRKAENRKEIMDQLASSIYQQGEQERKLGHHQLAADHFQRVGKIVPGSSRRIVADYDASTEYIALKDWSTAITLLEGFRKKYPEHNKWQQGISEKLALAYSNSGSHVQSAEEMMKLVKLTPKAKQKEMLLQAAELYDRAGQPKQVVSIYKKYVTQYPQPLALAIELRHKIAQYYATKKDSKNRHYWLKEIVRADGNGGKQRTARTRYLAATASLDLIEPLHRSYSSIKLTIPLKKSLKRKKELMKQNITAYSKAVKFQVEEVTTAATFNIAEIYREFASSLLSSDRPRNLNEEELEEYNYLLEDQAFPFEEKAINIHQSNLTRIPQGSYNESIKNSLNALARLLPFRYAKNEVTEKYVESQP